MPVIAQSYLARRNENFQVSKIPHHVVRNIVDYLVENNVAQDAESARASLPLYSSRELFDMYLIWNGIINYTDCILQALDGIRAAERGE